MWLSEQVPCYTLSARWGGQGAIILEDMLCVETVVDELGQVNSYFVLLGRISRLIGFKNCFDECIVSVTGISIEEDANYVQLAIFIGSNNVELNVEESSIDLML